MDGEPQRAQDLERLLREAAERERLLRVNMQTLQQDHARELANLREAHTRELEIARRCARALKLHALRLKRSCKRDYLTLRPRYCS